MLVKKKTILYGQFILYIQFFKFRVATEMNNNDDYFPILGICLGFELISFLAAGGVEHRFKCDSRNQVLPLEFSSGNLFLFKLII